jgi:outer membrane protein TolC
MPVSLIAIVAALAAQAGAPVAPAPAAEAPLSELPSPSGDPLRIDRARDPVLRLGRESTPPAEFMTLVEAAVERNPVVDEAQASIAEAEAAEDEARTGLYPTAEIALNSQRSIARNFEADDINNVVERSRARGRSPSGSTRRSTISARPRRESRPPARAFAPRRRTPKRRRTGSRCAPSRPGTTSSPIARW